MTTTPASAPAPSGDEPAQGPTGAPVRWARSRAALHRRLAILQEQPEAGMSTAEYAVGTVAACAFAAVLYRVVTGDSVVDGLTDLVDRALATLA
jgi:glutathione S-transferase